MTMSFRKRFRDLFRNPWYRFLSWLAGGFCGALLCLFILAGLIAVPVLAPLVFVLPPLGLIYGFAWGWLLMRRVARRSGVALKDSVLERSVAWQWHLGLLLGIPLFWALFFLILGAAIQPGELVSSMQTLPPPTPDAVSTPLPDPFFVDVLLTLAAVGALVGRSTVALWGVTVELRRTLNGRQAVREGV